ncbi:MAG: flagellar biosynthetic protein FliR [Treponema sp.]|nr:flagellar biosynthetic protein FliR [Candidatus Treponema equifaecale]
MLDRILLNAPVYLLICVRCFAVIMTLPLFSIRSVSRMAKLALTGYIAFIVLPHVNLSVYAPYFGNNGAFSIEYIMLIIGEGLIGILMGFYVAVIFAAFSTAGQFFAFQMGFSASEVYDALSQVENPLMGQFFNLIAMLIFLQADWAQILFGRAFVSSYESFNAISIISGREITVNFLLTGLTDLFADAFIIALPIMGTLILISVTMGILSKAAPQMNLLSEGFPIMILTSFFIIAALMPSLCDFFGRAISIGFHNLESLMTKVITGGA